MKKFFIIFGIALVPLSATTSDVSYYLKITGAADPFHIYQAHPSYAFALNSDDKGLWDRVESACGLLGAASDPSRPNFAKLGYKICIGNVNQERNQTIEQRANFCPPVSQQSTKIPLGPNSFGLLYLSNIIKNGKSYSYSDVLDACHQGDTSVCPQTDEEKFKVCKKCLLPILCGSADCTIDNFPASSCTTLDAALSNTKSRGYYDLVLKYLSNTSAVRNPVGVFPAIASCISSCLAQLEPTARGVRRKVCSSLPKVEYCISIGGNEMCVPYLW